MNNIPTKCEKCGSKLIERRGKKKDGAPFLFYGCEKYSTTGCDFSYWPPKQKEMEKIISNDNEQVIEALREIWAKLDEILEAMEK